MAIHRLYIEADNLQPAIDLLEDMPDGVIHILVGDVHNGESIITSIVSGIKDKQAVMEKMQRGELSIKTMADKSSIEKNIVVIGDK